MAKDLVYGTEARKALLSGADKLAKTVGVTMGPQGKNVIIGKFVGSPVITKDGVSVAREVVLEDPIEDLACQLIKEAAGRTADVAGDGTTTATVLAHEILKRGAALIDDNYSPLDFKRGVEWAVSEVITNLNSAAIEVSEFDDLRNIATISANNDYDLGENIAKAFSEVGRGGTVIAEAAPGIKTSVRFVDGVEISSGYVTSGFLTDPGQSDISIENCRVLVLDEDLTSLSSCLSLFNDLSNNNTPILILAKSIKQEALATLVANNKVGRLKSVAVNLPPMGIDNVSRAEWLECMAILTGTRVYSSARGAPISAVREADLGLAKRVVVNKFLTKILEGNKSEDFIKSKVEAYEKNLETLIGDSDRRDVRNRLAYLKNRAAVVTVGYSTELELREKGDRVEDSICATRAAVEEGYVTGGGTALLRAASKVNLSKLDKALIPAARVLLDACSRPIKQIIENSFEDPLPIIDRILKSRNQNIGYNAANGKFEDLVKAGVIDPKKVSRVALQNAASISLLLINTDAVVSEQVDNPSSWQPPPGWRVPEGGTLKHKY